MDPKTLAHSLRCLSTLNLVVSKEPLDVASVLAKLLRGITRDGYCRAVTRFGLMDIRAYLRGDTVVGHRHYNRDPEVASADVLEKMFRERTCETWGAGQMRDGSNGVITAPQDRPSALIDEGYSKSLAEAWKQDPKDTQFFYFVPDLWPELSDPKILASLMRFKDEHVFDAYTIKCVVVVTPTLDMVPESFRSMFNIHYDTGLTEKQAREVVEGDSGFLRVAGQRAAPEHLDEIVKLVTGLSTGDAQRMVVHSLVTQRRSPTRVAGFITTEGMLEWRLTNGKPLPEPPPTPVYRHSWERLGLPELEDDMDAIDADIEAGKQETYAKAKVEWAFLQGPILNRNETRTGDSSHDGGKLYMPDAEGVYRYVNATWTVTVWQRVHNPSSKDWAVQAHEHHIPGLVSQLRSFSTIAKARDEAERMFATLTGNMVVLPWPRRRKART